MKWQANWSENSSNFRPPLTDRYAEKCPLVSMGCWVVVLNQIGTFSVSVSLRRQAHLTQSLAQPKFVDMASTQGSVIKNGSDILNNKKKCICEEGVGVYNTNFPKICIHDNWISHEKCGAHTSVGPVWTKLSNRVYKTQMNQPWHLKNLLSLCNLGKNHNIRQW